MALWIHLVSAMGQSGMSGGVFANSSDKVGIIHAVSIQNRAFNVPISYTYVFKTLAGVSFGLIIIMRDGVDMLIVIL